MRVKSGFKGECVKTLGEIHLCDPMKGWIGEDALSGRFQTVHCAIGYVWRRAERLMLVKIQPPDCAGRGHPGQNVTPQLRTSISGLQAQCDGEIAIKISRTAIGIRAVDHFVAVRIEVSGQVSERSGLPNAGVACQDANPGRIQ